MSFRNAFYIICSNISAPNVNFEAPPNFSLLTNQGNQFVDCQSFGKNFDYSLRSTNGQNVFSQRYHQRPYFCLESIGLGYKSKV